MTTSPTDTYNGVPCLRVRTAGEAAAAEEVLRDQGRSYQTKIVKTRKRGLEYITMLLD